jgi:hypothetical protein
MKKIKYKLVVIPSIFAIDKPWVAEVYASRDDLVCKELIEAAIAEMNKLLGVSAGLEERKKWLTTRLKDLIGFRFVESLVTTVQQHEQASTSILAIRLLHEGFPSDVENDGTVVLENHGRVWKISGIDTFKVKVTANGQDLNLCLPELMSFPRLVRALIDMF